MAGYGVFALIENWDSVINVVIDMHKNKIAFMNTFLINREKNLFGFCLLNRTLNRLGVSFRKTESLKN